MARTGIKGSVKITLHNVHNGKNEVITGSNIVTNAVRDILGNNYLGALDMSKMLPLYAKWFGGVLAFRNAHPLSNGVLDPDDYYPQNNSANPLIAHAGDEAPSGAVIISEDYQRGSPTSRLFADGVVKQTWEWTPSQGNGVISAVSLTHKDTGNVGLGNNSSAFGAFSPLDLVQGNLPNLDLSVMNDDVIAQFDNGKGVAFYIGESGRYGQGTSSERFRFETDKITVNIRPLAYTKSGLSRSTNAVRSINGTTLEESFTVTIPFNVYCQPAYHFDSANKYLWIFSNVTSTNMAYDKDDVNYAVIDCVNKTLVTSGTIHSDTANLCPVSRERTGVTYSRLTQPNIIKDGNYVYLPTTNDSDFGNDDYVNGFKKINITNQGEQEQITFGAGQQYLRSYMLGGGLLVSAGMVVNGNTGYPCATVFPYADGADTFAFNEPYNPSTYVVPIRALTNVSMPRYIAANKMILSTKFNLPSSVTKTASQSMIIEYTLQEVTI